MNLPSQQDYRFRIKAYPYSPKGPACQRVEARINDTPVAKIFLEQGWHGYYFGVAKTGVKPGNNRIQFFYNYAEPPKLRSRNPDDRALSVAFDRLQVFARNQARQYRVRNPTMQRIESRVIKTDILIDAFHCFYLA